MSINVQVVILLALLTDAGCTSSSCANEAAEPGHSVDELGLEEMEEEALLQTQVTSGVSVRRVGRHTARHSGGGASSAAHAGTAAAPLMPPPEAKAPAEPLMPRGAKVQAEPPLVDPPKSTDLLQLLAKAWRLRWTCLICSILVWAVLLAGLQHGGLAAYKASKSAQSEPASAQPPPQAPPPSPAPRLSQCGGSFVIPSTRISRCSSATFSFDIPAWPIICPFRANFWRPSGDSAWTVIELTRDTVAAAGLPSLLTCKVSTSDAHAGGGAGAASAAAAAESPEFVVCSSPSVVVARGRPAMDGSLLVIHREGLPDLEVQEETGADEPWGVIVRRHGEDVGLASSIGSNQQRSEEYLQMDVQPDAESPEATLLLACMLAVIFLKPRLRGPAGQILPGLCQ
uniref:Uncharacterized protein n=1 Tax=Alexandrium monilatum TaxID=311494 RepID=A0A7S4T038_9DINO|mmetsp:Transcript_83513/g.258224  ORF Transcript_83513/g.258224 Transcript_83513/m.258224 type:complete len:399 (+) Transcript_83513:100-1296(+)